MKGVLSQWNSFKLRKQWKVLQSAFYYDYLSKILIYLPHLIDSETGHTFYVVLNCMLIAETNMKEMYVVERLFTKIWTYIY